MKCLDCPYMACKVFYANTEIWEGFCMNPNSPNYRLIVNGSDCCQNESITKFI